MHKTSFTTFSIISKFLNNMIIEDKVDGNIIIKIKKLRNFSMSERLN